MGSRSMKEFSKAVSPRWRTILLSAGPVLWAGFGILLTLTVFLVWDTLRAVEQIESTNTVIRGESWERERVMDRLRVDLQLSATLLRDVLLDADSARADRHRRELEQVRERLEVNLNEWAEGLPPGESGPYEQLRRDIRSYWDSMAPALRWRGRPSAKEASQFLQQEVLPRRKQLLEMANQLTAWNERRIETAEAKERGVYQGFRRRVWLAAAATLGVGLLVAGFSIYRIRHLEGEAERRYQEVVQARLQLQELSARLVSTQEEERRRLSRELHDEVGQSLSAVLVELGNLTAALPPENAGLRERAEKVRGLAEASVGVVRNMSLLLRPSMLDDLGLVPALKWQAREVARRHGVKVRVAAEAVEEELPDEHRTCVYRVVQEALQNVVRHAQAANARVTLRQEADRLVVMVQDDGTGFDTRQEKGLGLLGIEERVKRLGGSVGLASEPGGGTLVSASLPLPKRESQT